MTTRTTPIIIKTPQPDTEERLVLVPPCAVAPRQTSDGDRLCVRTDDARDATPADLLRGGWVIEMVEPTGPGTLAHLRADLRDMTARAEKAEATLAMHGRPTYVEAVERAEEAEANVERARLHASGVSTRLHGLAADLADAIARAERAERERDENAALTKAACELRDELRAERDTLRAELARLTAPGEGEPTDEELYRIGRKAFNNAAGLAGYSDAAGIVAVQAIRATLAVAHERARQQPKDRATDGDLLALAADAYRLRSREDATLDDMRKLALAVAAHVRKERCLVAQAVGMGVSICTVKERDGRWFVEAKDHSSVVQPADVPATLARLLGEVSRG